MAEPRDWVITKHGLFYQENRSGYTDEILWAGRYTRAEAEKEAAIEPATMSAWPREAFSQKLPPIIAERISTLETAKSELIAVIKFAIDIDDHFDRLNFLKDWFHGDLSEWPEFKASLAEAVNG